MRLGVFSILILILIGLILGLMVAGLPTYVTFLILGGIFVFYVSLYFPVLIIACLLFVVPFNILWIGVGVSSLEVIYGLTYVILAITWVLKRVIKGIFYITDKNNKSESLVSPVTFPLFVFFGVAVLDCIIGVSRGHRFQHWGSDLNAVMYYGVCFIMLDVIKDKRTLHKLFSVTLAAIILGLLKGIYIIIADFPPGMDILDVQHIRLSYTSVLGLAVFIISVAITATVSKGRKRAVFMMLSTFFILMLLASFARSLWIAGAFGLATLFLIAVEKQKHNFIKFILAVMLLFSLYLSIAISLPSGNPLFRAVNAVEQRYESIFTAMDEPSIMTRDSEWKEARRKALEHPFFGNGLGTQVTYFRYDQWFGTQTWITTKYIHNVYLSLFLNMGLLGLAVFLWFCFSLIRYGLILCRNLEDEMEKALTLGVTCAFLSLMVASLAGPLLVSPMLTMWFGFFIGSLIIFDRLHRKLT